MNKVDRAKTRIWVLQVELRSNFDETEANFKHQEAVSLSTALPELELAGSQVVKISSFNPSAIFTKQKQKELHRLIAFNNVNIVLINCNVSPVQQKNLEKAWNVKILDRTSLILEIFSNRAATREGVLQVEMAALSYQRTRLVRAWTHLERQRGGLGFVGGPGETQIESDKRAIDSQLKSLRGQLRKVVKTRELHRKRRSKTAMPIVSLVGYTNAGKSTLFNKLTKSRQAIVSDFSGLTKDRNYGYISFGEQKSLLIDTGGIAQDDTILKEDIAEQAWIAAEESSLIIFLLDGSQNLNKEDLDILSRLRKLNKAFITVLNKIDKKSDALIKED